MQVIRAEAMGMCFGVRDALAAIEHIEVPEVVTIHGELVHNEVVLRRLDERGFRQADESRRGLPETDAVLITAHGVSDVERRRLEAAGKRLIDTTCPLVLRAHRAARGLERLGYHVVVIGKAGHVEVRGIIEDLQAYEIVADAGSVRTWPHAKLGVVCQTTTPDRTVRSVRRAIEERNPHAEVRFVDTVCRPTKLRQRAVERLLDRVEAVVIVGGRNSNNTRELAELCRERGLPTFHIQDADELNPAQLRRFGTVGLSAGTSTLEETIDSVHRALVDIGRDVMATTA